MRHSHALKGLFSVLALLFPTVGPSQMPSQEGSMDDTSKPPTAPPALRSAGPLGLAAGPPADWGPAQQDAAPEGMVFLTTCAHSSHEDHCSLCR